MPFPVADPGGGRVPAVGTPLIFGRSIYLNSRGHVAGTPTPPLYPVLGPSFNMAGSAPVSGVTVDILSW